VLPVLGFDWYGGNQLMAKTKIKDFKKGMLVHKYDSYHEKWDITKSYILESIGPKKAKIRFVTKDDSAMYPLTVWLSSTRNFDSSIFDHPTKWSQIFQPITSPDGWDCDFNISY